MGNLPIYYISSKYIDEYKAHKLRQFILMTGQSNHWRY